MLKALLTTHSANKRQTPSFEICSTRGGCKGIKSSETIAGQDNLSRMDLEDVMKVIVGKELEISTDVISGQLCMERAENQKSVVVDISSEGSCV